MHRRQLVQILGASALAAQTTKFLTSTEAALVDRLADIIIPHDGKSPGAHEAGVIRYIDLVLKYADAAQQDEWRRGMAAVEAQAQGRFQKPFTALDPAQQDQIVDRMAMDEAAPRDDLARFFVTLKRLTVEAYHYSAIHWRENIGRDLNISTSDFPGCTHEHNA